MQCVQCSTPVPDDARYCQSCGSLVSDAEGQARASAAIDASGLQQLETMLREDTVGQYEIRGLLGRGGMAMVYLATETALNRKVAIKVLPPELTFGHGVERFKREAKTAAALDHPHIIPVYRVATGGKFFWYAMKYLEGRSLDDALKEKERLPLDETIVILDQVADALDYAHEHKVVHRDIKPANIMLDSRNRVVVTDFGIAKALTEGTLTASGSVIGTPFYMSPEQGMGKPVSGASDQYSVGVMAYRMLSGHVPFDGDSAIDILHKHCMTPAPPLDILTTGLPAHVAWAVSKSLEKDPARRFKTVRAFVEALKHPTAEAEMSSAATMIAGPAVKPGSPGAPSGATGRTKAPPPRPSVLQGQRTELMGSVSGAAAPAKPGRGKLLAIVAGVVVVAGAGSWIALSGRGTRDVPTQKPATDSTTQVSNQVVAQTPASPQPQPQPEPSVRQTQTAPPARRPPAPINRGPAGGSRPAPSVATSQPIVAPKAAAPVVESRGVLQIMVTGGWANVSIDGVSKGPNTRMQDSVSPGEHIVHFEREGYVTMDMTVTVTAGAATRVPVTLKPSSE